MSYGLTEIIWRLLAHILRLTFAETPLFPIVRPRLHICPRCGQMYSWASNLRKHLKMGCEYINVESDEDEVLIKKEIKSEDISIANVGTVVKEENESRELGDTLTNELSKPGQFEEVVLPAYSCDEDPTAEIREKLLKGKKGKFIVIPKDKISTIVKSPKIGKRKSKISDKMGGGSGIQEEIKIAEKTRDKIPYKVVTPKLKHSIDSIEDWALRNIHARERNKELLHTTLEPPAVMMGVMPTRPKVEPPYRITFNLKKALEAIDDGVEIDVAALAYGINANRLKSIVEMEKQNPHFVLYRQNQSRRSEQQPPSGQYPRQRRSRGLGRYVCENCNRRYYELKNLKRHIKECGQKPTYQCVHCPFRSIYKTQILLHGSVHNEVTSDGQRPFIGYVTTI
ncbi:hypothetical protein QAD02_022643 [Eretmocerus hayati]|uniref:Uncharacterized protein n=1 Tax=Eretmocerus hayati TaxID=131215 RepID=A0ACC2PU87_9HYME|nr:hypothetical protein QAD02_022643 [Eretmocerus hayati]